MFSFFYEGKLGQMLAPSKTPAEQLHDAVYCGNSEKFEQLVAQGTDVTATNSAGNNLLHVAAYHGHAGLVHRLLKLGAQQARVGIDFGHTHIALPRP